MDMFFVWDSFTAKFPVSICKNCGNLCMRYTNGLKDKPLLEECLTHKTQAFRYIIHRNKFINKHQFCRHINTRLPIEVQVLQRLHRTLCFIINCSICDEAQ